MQTLLLILFVLGFLSTYDLLVKGFCLWGVGMFMGMLLRDLGWFLRLKMQWPFTEAIIDWSKVEAIAEGKITLFPAGPKKP
jgi:hypothetical protein